VTEPPASSDALPVRGVNERANRKTILIGLAGASIIRLLASTWRIRVVHGERLEGLRATGKPFIFSLWHGQMLPLIWHHRGHDVGVLISQHKDGEIIARIAHALGLWAIRGSTTRGAARALIEMVNVLGAGREIAITPDGPRGPARSFAPGAVVVAFRAKVPILPVAASASRAWRLTSWDGFMIPKPFARVTIAYGEPAFVEATTARQAAEEAGRFTALMDEAVTLADGRA
jgi:lysophospholipid acyltransferase (LPLAT)-like uncharacterized protein